jgi:hypothetical protein
MTAATQCARKLIALVLLSEACWVRRTPSAHLAWSTSSVRGGHRMGTVAAGCRVVNLRTAATPAWWARYYPALSVDTFPSCGCHANPGLSGPVRAGERRCGSSDVAGLHNEGRVTTVMVRRGPRSGWHRDPTAVLAHGQTGKRGGPRPMRKWIGPLRAGA